MCGRRAAAEHPARRRPLHGERRAQDPAAVVLASEGTSVTGPREVVLLFRFKLNVPTRRYPERSGASHARPVQTPFPISLTRLCPQNLDSDPLCISRVSVLLCWVSPSTLNPILKASFCYPGLGICQGQEEQGWGVGGGRKSRSHHTLGGILTFPGSSPADLHFSKFREKSVVEGTGLGEGDDAGRLQLPRESCGPLV